MSTIRCPLAEAAAISPHQTAIIEGAHLMIFTELDEMAARAARNLRRLGIGPGTRVALFLETSWRTVALLFGCWRAGVTACPLNTRLPRAAVEEQIRRIAARFLIARANSSDQELGGARILPPDELLIYREPDADEKFCWPLRLDAAATILFTSGSSGPPKAAEHSIANHYYSARGANQNIRLGSRDCWLLALPLYHVGGIGILFRCAMAGAAMAIPEAGESLERAQERYGVTHLSLVPTHLYRLIHGPGVPDSFRNVKAILVGGAPLPASLLAEALRRRWPVYTTYGLTEMASQVCTMTPTSPPAKRMTSGRVLNHREIRIAEDGEILVRGATLFNGYVNDGQLDRARDADGWFATGDLGSIDADGYLTVLGRKDNMFISGGENIQPEEIEAILCSMPEIEEAAVAPRPDPEFGARPVAFIRWRGDSVPEADLRARLAAVLPKYKIPDAFHPWPSNGDSPWKLDRAELRTRAASLP
ncbi:MAG: o-succinylbenzoate--CoA ligase [Kiritimatiellae bacterium]|nr:o-succinylbenzoate--CoA ligase [Kiritimatiellia bacterium]MDW8459260.1 o-succinylbenzoate--CoA ligase [Verrucomicrobiota bacterium]